MRDPFENLGPLGEIAAQIEVTNFSPMADAIRVVACCTSCGAEQAMDVDHKDILASGNRPAVELDELRNALRAAPIGHIFVNLTHYPRGQLVLWVGARCDAEGQGGPCGGLIEAIEEVHRIKGMLSAGRRQPR